MVSAATTIHKPDTRAQVQAGGAAFMWLSAFYIVYCARPEDWFPLLSFVPLAKITAIGAFLAILFTKKRARKLKDLPAESYFLLLMIGILLLSGFVSPIWRGGGVSHALDFGKVYLAWVLTFLLITDLSKFRRIIFTQAVCVPMICLISMIKGHGRARLDSVLNGIYSNPNDLAFAIVLSLPFCLMFLLSTRKPVRKILWTLAILISALALFKTASRGGFITLIVSGTVCLWHFGVKGKRFFLLFGSFVTIVLLSLLAGGTLKDRLLVMWTADPDNHQERVAYESYEDRQQLMEKSVDAIIHYPVLGLGAGNFEVYSGEWREVHMTYLQIAAEGGIPALILYLLFFGRGFLNLRRLLKMKNASAELKLFSGALHSSLIGFVVGALFSPEAYQFFPYFAVAYTSALLALVRESERNAAVVPEKLPAVAPRNLSITRQLPIGSYK